MTHNNNNDDAQAGARVVVPRGSFKTGSVMLRSNLDLHLEAGAGLYGSDDWSEYPVVAGLPFGTMFRALISGYNLTNVSVTGSNLAVPASGDPATDSIIDGVGWSWWCIGKHMPVWPVPYCHGGVQPVGGVSTVYHTRKRSGCARVRESISARRRMSSTVRLA